MRVNHPSNARAGVFLFIIAMAHSLGCGDKPQTKQFVPAEGVVTLDGKPAIGVVVTFVPEDTTGGVAAGRADKKGVFHLQSFPTDEGIRPGRYRVVISPAETGGYTARPALDGAVSRLPSRYFTPNTTPLEVTIPSENPIELALVSK